MRILRGCIAIALVALIPSPHSVHAASSWELVGEAGFSAATAAEVPMVIGADDVPYVAFRDGANASKASVMRYVAGDWEFVGAAGFTSGAVSYLSIAYDSVGGELFVAFKDAANNDEAGVMSLVSGNWASYGTDISPSEVFDVSLIVKNGVGIYVGFKDTATSSAGTVKNFGGSSWGEVGNGITAGEASYTSLAFDSNNRVLLAYADGANGDGASVMRYEGDPTYEWTVLGTLGFSAGAVTSMSIATDDEGAIYVAYADSTQDDAVTVKEFNGTSWVTVGTEGFTAPSSGYPRIALDSDGVPYVAYIDSSNGNKATVERYVGGEWEVVGTAGFSEGAVDSLHIAIDSEDQVYVSFSDDANSDKATVMRFVEAVEYTLTFNSQEGSSVASRSLEEGATTTLPEPSRSGYSFVHWNTQANGAGTGYDAESSFAMPGSNTTLYAIWDRNNTSSGAKKRYGCKDIAATNFDQFVAHNQQLCEYATATTESAVVVVRDLEYGSVGSDVKRLQMLLNEQGFIVAPAGPGSVGNETEYFGEMTRAALIAYQTAHSITPAAGYFGPITRAHMKAAGLPGWW